MKRDTAQLPLAIGDIVTHRILGTDKVIVGLGKDRYFCVPREDIQEDGRLRPEACVALHRRENLDKTGHYGVVIAVDLSELGEKEFKQIHHFRRRNIFREEVIPYSLFLLASILIVLGILSGVENIRAGIETTFFRKVEEKKTELRREIEKVRQ